MKNKYFNFLFLFALVALAFFMQDEVFAKDLVGSQFIVRDPVIGTGGEYATSSNFKLFSGGDTLLTGVNSGSTYIGHYGFLYYPTATAGTLSVVQTGINADLSWGATTASGGWTVSGYNTGKATVPGGPYTYTSVGNVTSYSYAGIAPGYYCFVVQTLDTLSYVIATSNEQCITITAALSFSLGSNSVNLGTLTTGAAGTGSHTASVATNAPSGFAISYNGATLTNTSNPSYTLPLYSSSVSSPGTAGFGINLKDNATPNIGAEPVANYGACGIASGYGTVNQYTFVASTTTAINSVTAAADCVYTASYVGNISSVTAAGAYSSTITYIATGTF
ncbi:MAG: hypothetical protein M3Q34_02465 [bacterium]|nr:hypothetical protein [bacterium]